MRVAVLLLMFVGCGVLQAQTNRWTQVERLRPGSRVTVTTSHRAPCVLRQVSDDGMECLFHGGIFWVERARVAEVSVPAAGKAAAIGTAVGVFAGASIEAATDYGSDPAKVPRLLIGAGLGGCVGWIVGHAGSHAERVVYIAPFSSP